VDEERLLGRELEEAGRGADRPPRLVHVRLGLEEGKPPVAGTQLGEPAGELRAERAAVAPRQLVGDEPADVVPRPLVLAARVAEAHDEQVERRGGLASTEQAQLVPLQVLLPSFWIVSTKRCKDAGSVRI